ncbi:MAG: glutaminase [Rhodospirillales bacterium]
MTLQATLDEIHDAVRPYLGEGKVAQYIPALATADPKKFAIAAVTVDGEQFVSGDADHRFSLQSISKVFTLTLALNGVGADLWKRVGREPSGSPFNSLVQLEYELGIPRNPLINAGALVVTDVIVSRCGKSLSPIETILGFIRTRAGNDAIAVDEEIARSEAGTGFRNAAMGNFIKSFKNLENDVAAVLDVYFKQCSITVSCRELSRSMLYLANGGVDPMSGERVVAPERARRINAIMLTCGHYDASGDFAFRVGLPGKSGVSGGIVAVVPGKMALAVYSPGLNEQGNSQVGTLALEMFAARTGNSIF